MIIRNIYYRYFIFFTFRLPELRQILTLNGGMDPIECSKLLDELIRKHDKNGDGKFNFQGKYREKINAVTD